MQKQLSQQYILKYIKTIKASSISNTSDLKVYENNFNKWKQ